MTEPRSRDDVSRDVKETAQRWRDEGDDRSADALEAAYEVGESS